MSKVADFPNVQLYEEWRFAKKKLAATDRKIAELAAIREHLAKMLSDIEETCNERGLNHP